MDEDDEFLYGSSSSTAIPVQTPSVQQLPVPSALVAQLEKAASSEQEASDTFEFFPPPPQLPQEPQAPDVVTGAEEADSTQESESDDDVEFIMEAPSRSLDLRPSQPAPKKPSPHISYQQQQQKSQTTLSTSSEIPTTQSAPSGQPASATTPMAPNYSTPAPAQGDVSIPGVLGSVPGRESIRADLEPTSETPQESTEPPIDTDSLPPAYAPSSHPSINPTVDGTIEGRSILDVDLSTMSEKPWRRPGSDISDWFNYGFDEISWEAYCYRRRDLGDLANVLKASVLNFTGMPEDQITQLPPEVRNMVMTGTSAMLNQNSAAAAAAAFPHPGMMDISMMGNPMDMGMGMMMPPAHDVGPGGGIPTPNIHDQGNGTSMQQDPEYMEPSPMPAQGQPPYGSTPAQHSRDTSEHPPTPGGLATGRSSVPLPASSAQPGIPPYTSRGGGPPGAPQGPRGSRGGYIRGRGRGFIDTRPPPPHRPVSPLPANVPTGPRNQNKYKDKDRDGSGVGGDGLDYGGGKDRESEERDRDRDRERDAGHGRGRKRRGSPSYDERAASKRR